MRTILKEKWERTPRSRNRTARTDTNIKVRIPGTLQLIYTNVVYDCERWLYVPRAHIIYKDLNYATEIETETIVDQLIKT